MRKSSIEECIGASAWLLTFVLFVIKSTGLINMGWSVVFAPLWLPIIIATFLVLIITFLITLVSVLIFGTLFVLELIERIKS